MAVTLKQIAVEAGVSHPTVSDVLNGHWRRKGISASTAARIEAIAAKHNYRPNRLVRGLRTGRTETIAVVLPGRAGLYFYDIEKSIEEEARRHGYHAIVANVPTASRDEIPEIDMLVERRVDGLIVVPIAAAANRENYRALLKEDVPLVFVDGHWDDVPCIAVTDDGVRGGYLATRHLLDLGHRRVAFLANKPVLSMNIHQREAGYRQALAEAGVDTCVTCHSDLGERLSGAARPTAVFASTDYDALRAIAAAEMLGLRVPQDLAVVGYSDCIEYIERHRVPLTSVRSDTTAMGRLAFETLLRIVAGSAQEKKVLALTPELVVRESSGEQRRTP